MHPAVIITGAVVAFVAIFVGAGRPLLRNLQGRTAQRAIALFRTQREQLEAKFFDLASRRGKPRGVRWVDCDWQDEVVFGRELESGMITAFAAVNIQFEAVEGEDMEEIEFVSALRDATAMFHFQGGQWGTGGRALFNMDPANALMRLNDQYESVEVSTN